MRNRSFALLVISALAGCGGISFFGQGADQGGITIRCQVMFDTFSTVIPHSCLLEDVDNDDFNPVQFNPKVDYYGNSFGFATDEPDCTSITVDACVPRWIMVNGQKYDIKNILDATSPAKPISTLKGEAIAKVEVQCDLAAGWMWASTSGGDTTKPQEMDLLAKTFVVDNAKAGRLEIVYPGKFNDPVTEEPDPTVGTRALEDANGCRPGYRHDDPNFPYYERSVFINKNSNHVAGIANLDAARSTVVVTVSNGDKSDSAVTQAQGQLIGDKVTCQLDPNGVEQCRFGIPHLVLSLAPFPVAGRTVRLTSLANEGDAFGSSNGSTARLPAGSIQLIGEFRLDGTDQGFIGFTNDQDIVGTWDPEHNTFQIGLNLSATTSDGQKVIIQGTVGGGFYNRSPIPVPGPDQTLECSGSDGTVATLDGSASHDLDGPISGYEWFGPDPGSFFPLPPASFARGAVVTTPLLSVGTHKFILRVRDSWGWQDQEPTHVTIVDTQAPNLVVESLDPACLWPPDHRLVQYNLGQQLIARAFDACSGDVSSAVRIVNVVSNQPTNGAGDGNTSPDIVFNDAAFCVRSERSGDLGDRVYTVTLQGDDHHGNVTTTTVEISVPGDQREHVQCRDSRELQDCTINSGGSGGAGGVANPAADAVAPATNVATTTATQLRGGCSVSPTTSGDSLAVTVGIVLLALLSRRRLALVAMILALGGCSSKSANTASLTLQVDSKAPIAVSATPFLGATQAAVVARVADSNATVFVSMPRGLVVAGGMIPVGVNANQATVWGQPTGLANPLTAASGTVNILQVGFGDSDAVQFQIVNAAKPLDPSGDSVTISGEVQGRWNANQ